MFDLGWSELLLVAVLAIVFIGPKDLPRVMRTLGQYVGKMKAMAREFQNSFEDLARETELDDLRKQVADLRDTTMKPLSEPLAEMERAIKNAGTAPPEQPVEETATSPERPTELAAKPDPAAPTSLEKQTQPDLAPQDPAPQDPASQDQDPTSQDPASQNKGSA